MEAQLTDFENAAFSVFIVLLTRVILSFNLNFYIPITKVDENMRTAHKRGAVTNDKFYFRKNIFSSKCNLLWVLILLTLAADTRAEAPSNGDTAHAESEEDEDAYELMTMDQIMNGQDQGFPGLIPLVDSYLNSVNVDIETRQKLQSYLSLISRRASGELMTGATYLRKLVTSHPDYKQDSVVSPSINYDLIKTVDKVAKGELKAPELLGDFDA